MSKGPEGPAAQSFDNPRKTGWLHKHGGSGMSSHWKKRWFIADHHYLFYYKGPNDKKPVGILCLPEYQSCHKADTKECKKSNSFVLERGAADSDSADGAGKNYILQSDCEGEMEKWIGAIKEEMKPILGGDIGLSSSYSSTPKPKIDQKAFDEVTAIAAEGPKLSHPTASRPKPRGRRPPKKYAVFHEDDSKDDDSPTITPSPSSSSLSSKPLPASPTTSPANSPRVPKKGNQPTTPLLPSKTPMTPPKPKSSTLDKAESGTSSKPTVKPEPPRKVSKEKQDSAASTPDADSPKLEPKVGPRPTPRPKKQLPATPAVTTDAVHTEVSEEPPTVVKAVPTVKPKPVPPKAKPRTPSISLQNSLESSETPSGKEGPAPPPQPKPRRSLSPEAEVVPPQVTKKPRPVPAPRKPEGPKPAKDDVEQVNNAGEEAKKEDAKEDSNSEIAKNKESEIPEETENKDEVKTDSSLDDELQTEVKKEIQQDDTVEDKMDNKMTKEPEVCYSEVTNGVVNSDHEPKPGGKKESQGKEDGSYEDMDYDSESTKQNGESSEKNGQNQFAYVEMSPGATDSSQDKSNEYEPVEVIVSEDEDKNDYEVPQDWNEETVASARSSGGFVPMVLKPGLTDEQMAIYDVPPTPRPAIQDDRPSSSATGDSITSQSQEAASRSNSVASSASLSSKNSANSPVLRPRTGSQDGNPPAAVAETSSTSNLEQRIETLEDSIENTTLKQSSVIDSHPKLNDSSEADTVNKVLLQAKEILRLAKAAKDEADELKKESACELELAKRERHDAALMKKNAAEILRIAKGKLNGK